MVGAVILSAIKGMGRAIGGTDGKTRGSNLPQISEVRAVLRAVPPLVPIPDILFLIPPIVPKPTIFFEAQG